MSNNKKQNKMKTSEITTKRTSRGEYEVYKFGVFVGTITNNSTENSREWAGYDLDNEWINTFYYKKDCLSRCGWMIKES